jgi:hypothetical protein
MTTEGRESPRPKYKYEMIMEKFKQDKRERKRQAKFNSLIRVEDIDGNQITTSEHLTTTNGVRSSSLGIN